MSVKINPIRISQPLIRKEPETITLQGQATRWVYVFTGIKFKQPEKDLFLKSGRFK